MLKSSRFLITCSNGVQKMLPWQKAMMFLRIFRKPHQYSGLMEKKKSDILEYENGYRTRKKNKKKLILFYIQNIKVGENYTRERWILLKVLKRRNLSN
jgi:hypothetical protein